MKMKRIFLYSILSISALAFGCRKIDVEPTDGKPVFSAEAKFDGSTKQWQAGVDDFYMYSSFEKDPLGIYEFTGRLANTDSAKLEAFTIRIRDFQPSQGNQVNIDEALKTNIAFQFATIENTNTIDSIITIGYKTTLDASSSILPNTPVNYHWDFGDGTTLDTTEIVTHNFNDSPTQPIKLTVSAMNNACTSSLTRKLTLPGTDSCQLLMDLYLATPVSIDSGFILEADLLHATPPFYFSWGNGSNGFNVDSILIKDSIGIINAAVTITDATGCTVSADITTNYSPGALPQLCLANFVNSTVVAETDTIQITVVNDSLQLSKIKIEYTSPDGILYSSYLHNQPIGSFLKILKTEDYDNNEKNEKTKKLTLSYNCRIWSQTGDFMDITDGKAIIAVAYP
jgi:hypothetical protein